MVFAPERAGQTSLFKRLSCEATSLKESNEAPVLETEARPPLRRVSLLASFSGRGRFKALHYHNFALLWIGLILSNVGTWVQVVTQSLLVISAHAQLRARVEPYFIRASGPIPRVFIRGRKHG